jgi:uncharacterized FlaG/YvyC family protein
MKSTLNPTEFRSIIYNRKTSDQAITTIPKRDKIIPGSKIFDATAQSIALYKKDVQQDTESGFNEALEANKEELSEILQAFERIDDAISAANDMRRTEQERRQSAQNFMQTLIDNRWSIRFEMDHELKQIITQMVEVGSGEVKRTFPPEKTIDFKRFLQEYSGNTLDMLT